LRHEVSSRTCACHQNPIKEIVMIAIATLVPVLAAGWSLLYLLGGGGIFGAIILFFGLKAIGH